MLISVSYSNEYKSGNDIRESVKVSIDYVQNGIKNAPDFGSGNGPIRHF